MNEVIIKETHRGLHYVDGALKEVLAAGRYELPDEKNWLGSRRPKHEIVLVDVREKEITIKGQEILTADKVAVRVSIIVLYKVVDPVKATHQVANAEERLYSDVQLAARRSLASMTLEQILTNRNQLSDDILGEVRGPAGGYGVDILRASVKDLAFPGNLQEIMNKVLTAERLSEAQLVESRTNAEQQRIKAEAQAQIQKIEAAVKLELQLKEAEAQSAARKKTAEAEVEAFKLRHAAEIAAMEAKARAAQSFAGNTAALRLRELEAIAEIAKNANARIFIGFDKHSEPDANTRAIMS
jgi:regulator of protease activity HflC (stomatin/prohibitin superfamily)